MLQLTRNSLFVYVTSIVHFRKSLSDIAGDKGLSPSFFTSLPPFL